MLCRKRVGLTASIVALVILGFASPSRAGYQSELRYHLQWKPGPTIEVTVQFSCDGESTTDVHLMKEWGGVVNDGSDVSNLSVVDNAQRSCKVTQVEPTVWHIEHPPNAEITVRYEIAKKGERVAIRGNDYRTRLDDGMFQMIGHLGLITPRQTRTEETTSIGLSLGGFHDGGWDVVSSFGPGEGPFEFRGTPSDFLHSILLAGKIQMIRRKLGGNEIAVAMVGSAWTFSADELADMVVQVVQAERDFFQDHSDPWFLVTLTPVVRFSPVATSMGGTALHQAFSLFCTPNLAISKDSEESMRTLWLLAHEYFHTWNGVKIPTAGEDPSTYWFSEGFTNFYARRVLLRSGLITPDQYTEDLNSALSKYDTNPVRSLGNEHTRTAFWSDRNAQELPYQQGDLVALMLDERIAQNSGGKKSLDDFMIDLFRNPLKDSPVTTDSLLKRLGDWVDAETVAQVREIVVKGAEVDLPRQLREPELQLAQAKLRSFDPGFDMEKSRDAKEIVGVVESSNAFEAGLRDGQPLREFSVQSAENPPRAELTVVADGKLKKIQYDALSQPHAVRAYRAGIQAASSP